MNLPRFHARFQGRQGIALLLVLVMATLLAAVAVSMVSTLRVDRMASVNYRDSVTARSAIPDVVDDALRRLPYLSNALTGCPALLTLDHRPPNNGLYRVGGPNGALSAADRASLITPETLEYFTPDHRNPASLAFQSPSWSNIVSRSDGSRAVRYYAVVEDQSGLIHLDALRPDPTAPLPRAMTGRDCWQASDINFSTIWTVDGGAMPVPPLNNTFGTLPFYENMAEIRTYATAQNPGQGKLFSTFSHNPIGTFTDTLQRIDRRDLPSITRTDFILQMDAMGFNRKRFQLSGAPVQTQSQVLWDMYTDYVDKDDTPSNDYIANEVAAFVNELYVPIRISNVAGTTYSFEINPRMEMHFPWHIPAPATRSPKYTASAKIELEFEFLSNSAPPARHTQTVSVDIAPFTDEFPRVVPPPKDARFIMSPDNGSLTTQNFLVPFPAVQVNVNLRVQAAEVRLEPGGSVVDAVVDSTRFPMSISGLSVGKEMFWHAEVLDPRINKVFGGVLPEPSDSPSPPLNLSPWRINSSGAALTPDNVNSYTATLLGGARGLFDEPPVGSAMINFVKNAPMELVGELGYLPIGAWQTIRLISSDGPPAASIVAHPVSDYFSCPILDGSGKPKIDPVTRQPVKPRTRGRINPNTHEPRVLEALFHLMPADTVPYVVDPATVAIDNSIAAMIAGPISRRVSLPPPLGGSVSPGYPYLNPSDAFNTPDLYRLLRTNAALLNIYPNELRRESIVRNSIELLNTRNQLYQILILVQALSSDGFPLATEKALVQVWHDGVSSSGASGAVTPSPYPYLIRQVVFLND